RREPGRPIAFHLSCCGINVCRRAADPFAIVFRLLLWRAKPLRYPEIEAGRTVPAQEFGQSFGELRIESEASHRVGLFDNARNVADKNHSAPLTQSLRRVHRIGLRPDTPFRVCPRMLRRSKKPESRDYAAPCCRSRAAV